MKEEKYIIQVAPITPLPISKTQIFSYLYHESPLKGTLVAIPFFRRQIEGIVISSNKYFSHSGSFELKMITKVIEASFLTEKQIELAKFISSYYFAPLGMVLKSMIPRRVKYRLEKKNSTKENMVLDKKNPKKKSAGSNQNILVLGSKNKRQEYILKRIKETIRLKKQCLILVPEIFYAYSFFEHLKNNFPKENISLIHSKIAKGKLYHEWKIIKNNGIKIIVASKIGVFLPYFDVGLVIVEQDQDLSHKQSNAAPRYNAVSAAEFLARDFGADLIYDNAVSSLKNFISNKNGNLKIINFHNDGAQPQTEVVNLALEKKKTDFPISESLYNNLARAIRSKKQAILLVNRRGLSTFSVCQNCSQILKCPHCKKSLVYFEEHEQYRCLHCSHKVDLLSSCPKCGGSQFSHFGIGIQMVEKKLRRFFPTANIARLDSDVMKNAKKYQEINDLFGKGKIDILLGTQISIRDIAVKNIGLVCIIAGHDFPNAGDFNSREIALLNFIQAKQLLDKKGKLIIQTFLPFDPLIESVKTGKLENFFENEIKFRKKMNYPPFKKLIKLVYRGDSKEQVAKETRKAFDDLTSRSDNKLEISEPYQPLTSEKRGLYLTNILIKISSDQHIEELPIFPVLGSLKRGWVVDVDPISTV
jgi:primosomal protein N' (replication factor Y) (superfamily II helicase)